MLNALDKLLAFPTISADPACRPALLACARWLASYLQGMGMPEVFLLPGYGGPPGVYAAWRGAPGKPTLLLYAHYDVQPPGDLRSWHSPPFRATRRGPFLYARGASDDKGQLMIMLSALERMLKKHGRLPVNLLVWLEGEEEVGSPHLPIILARHRRLFHADAMLVCDTEMVSDRPSLTYGLRGMLSASLTVTRPGPALHSGRYGGVAVNPAQMLAELLTGLQQAILLGSFPELVVRQRPVSIPERRMLALAGAAQQAILRPSMSITRLVSGAVQSASIPASASAEINIRLVPDQQPHSLKSALERYLADHTAPGLELQLKVHSTLPAVLLPHKHMTMQAAIRAVQAVWGAAPVLTRSGGSIGPVAHFWHRLGMPAVLLGFGRPGDQIHAANERIFLPDLERGSETIMRMLEEYGR